MLGAVCQNNGTQDEKKKWKSNKNIINNIFSPFENKTRSNFTTQKIYSNEKK